MDTKRLLTAMMIAIAAMLAWQLLMDRWFESQGWRRGAADTEEVAPPQPEDPEAPPATVQTEAVAVDPSAPEAPPAAPGKPHVLPGEAPSRPIILGSLTPRDETYSLALNISPRGAGLESVTLNQFRQEVREDELYTFQTPYANGAATSLPLETQSITVNGTTIDLGDVDWSIEPDATDERATYFVTIGDAQGQPLLRISKLFQVGRRQDAGVGYESLVQQTVTNLSSQPLTVQLTMFGPTTPPRELDRGHDRHMIAGYAEEGRVRFDYKVIEEFDEDHPTRDFTKGPRGQPLVWAGASSVYFNAIVRPSEMGEALLARVEARVLDPQARRELRQIAMTLETREFTLAAAGDAAAQQVIPLQVFFGPKQRRVLQNDYYSSPLISYNQTLVMVGQYCGICTWQWLIDVLVWMLRAFHVVLRDWGLAIIALVCVVRALLHPITKRSQISMMKMAKLGPEMERLKKKHGDNKEELNKAMWEFQKQQGIGPYLGCLPMFLQMPIWIALWQALQSTFELRHAPFLHFGNIKLTWIYDLAKPDHLIEFGRTYELFFIHISGLNVLPILLGVVFFVQNKLMPKPATMSPEQAQQQKIMMWMMSLLFPLFLYGGPSGLNLYILTSTTLGIIESKIVRAHVKKREEEEAAGKVIVDAGKRGHAGGKAGKAPEPKKTPQTGIAGWLARMQAKAEEIRREAERRGNKKA